MHGAQHSIHSSDCKTQAIKTHYGKVVKILGVTFILIVLQVLYGKSYMTEIAFKFIDDEYDNYTRA